MTIRDRAPVEPTYWAGDLETLSADELDARAGRSLVRQLGYVAGHSPFYQRKLAAAGVELRAIRGVEDLRYLPFTEKEELRVSQEEHPPLGWHAAVPMGQTVRIHASSGTTGKPSFVGLTARDSAGWSEMTARCLYAGGVRPETIIAYAFNIGFFCGGLANTAAIEAIGSTLVPIGTGASDRLMAAIRTIGVNQITCTPSYILYFAGVVRDKYGIDPAQLGITHLILGGEPGGGVPGVREAIQQEWGATVFDSMGNADLAPVFLGECPERTGMHFMGQDFLYAELIDPETATSLSMADGVEGELVVTHLDRECVPLVRFRTRDRVVVWTSPCACGRTSFRLRCIGRTDDMLIVLGVNVFPSAVKDVVMTHRPRTTGELLIQIDQPGPRVDPPLHVQIEHGPDVRPEELPALADRLNADLRAKLIVPTQVELVPPGTLPRSEMKSQSVRVVAPAGQRRQGPER